MGQGKHRVKLDRLFIHADGYFEVTFEKTAMEIFVTAQIVLISFSVFRWNRRKCPPLRLKQGDIKRLCHLLGYLGLQAKYFAHIIIVILCPDMRIIESPDKLRPYSHSAARIRRSLTLDRAFQNIIDA